VNDPFTLAIRMLPVGDSFNYQLIDMRTLACLRPLTFEQAEAMQSELLPVVFVNATGTKVFP
jgi:hypothetical protein